MGGGVLREKRVGAGQPEQDCCHTPLPHFLQGSSSPSLFFVSTSLCLMGELRNQCEVDMNPQIPCHFLSILYCWRRCKHSLGENISPPSSLPLFLPSFPPSFLPPSLALTSSELAGPSAPQSHLVTTPPQPLTHMDEVWQALYE